MKGRIHISAEAQALFDSPRARRGHTQKAFCCLILAVWQWVGSNAIAMPAAPAGVVESGAPSFVVLGPESMGLSAQPTDLHLLPDGRILAVSLRELAFGDGLRWEVYRGVEGSEFIAPQIAIDADGKIYTGIQGGFASVDLGTDARWHLTRVADVPLGAGMDKLTLAWVDMLKRDWFWFSGSGSVVAWRPGQTPHVATNAESAIEHIFELGENVYVSDQAGGALFQLRPGETKLERISTQKVMVSEAVTCTAPLAPGKLLAGTSFEGMKVFDGQNFQRFGNSRILGPGHRITGVCAITEDLFAAAVDTLGVVFFDRTGSVVQILDRSLDQRLGRVKRLLYSADGVVWALLNEGIARIQFPSPLSHFEPVVASGLVYAKPLRHQGSLWLLTDGRAMRGIYDRVWPARAFRGGLSSRPFSFHAECCRWSALRQQRHRHLHPHRLRLAHGG